MNNDPLVGSAVVNGTDMLISDSSDNADLLDFCFLCSRQFFHENLDYYDIKILKDEEILEFFFEELGPVDRSLLQCCPTCKALCKTLIRTKEAFSSLIDEIFQLLLGSRKVSYLVSKSRVVSRLFQSSNASLPPCETSNGFFPPPPLSHIQFPKDISNNANNNSNTSFPSQFDLRLDSSNLSDSLDISFSRPMTPLTVNNVNKKSSPFSKKLIKNEKERLNDATFLAPVSSNGTTAFGSLYNESIMNSVSDNACDVSEEVIIIRDNQREPKITVESIRPYSLPAKLAILNIYPPQSRNDKGSVEVKMPSAPTNHSIDKEPQCPKEDQNRRIQTEIKSLNKNQGRGKGKGIKISSSSCNQVKKKESIQKKFTPPILLNCDKQIKSKKSTSNKKPTGHECHECNKSFMNARNLRNHLSAHADERKFICEICGASYRHKTGLDAHVAIHNGNSKFKCDICEKSFTQNAGLQRHMALHAGKRQFQCDKCGKQFIHHTSLMVHKRIHEGTKDFECSECDAKFSTKSHLQRHMRIHSGEKLHECHICQKTFSERYNLRAHLKSHEENRASIQHFECQFCPKKFTRKFKLQQHTKHVHVIDK